MVDDVDDGGSGGKTASPYAHPRIKFIFTLSSTSALPTFSDATPPPPHPQARPGSRLLSSQSAIYSSRLLACNTRHCTPGSCNYLSTLLLLLQNETAQTPASPRHRSQSLWRPSEALVGMMSTPIGRQAYVASAACCPRVYVCIPRQTFAFLCEHEALVIKLALPAAKCLTQVRRCLGASQSVRPH